ncbi:MAG: hypothetical protein IPN72_08660 [Saprospiraceae bacterium]|nr:hypothetical protein [Saprospiraceae bacterium]
MFEHKLIKNNKARIFTPLSKDKNNFINTFYKLWPLYHGNTQSRKGVFAGLPISEGDSIEVCHIVKMAKAEIPIIQQNKTP